MNQRTDPVAGLRAYFEDLNRVAPGDEQLGLVVARTSTTVQRPAWQARLPQIGRFGDVAGQLPLRYGLVAVAMLLAVWSVSVAGSAPPLTGFAGRWTSIDHDGSTQTLDVAPGSAPDVQYEDRKASGCADHGDDSVDFHAAGRGSIVVDRLVVAFPSGGCHTWQVEAYTVTFVLHRSSDTMSDQDGTVWHRVR